MASIDIRDLKEEEIDKIVFSSSTSDACCVVESGGVITLETFNGCSDSDVDIKDIDNLILALKKAKELWVKGE